MNKKIKYVLSALILSITITTLPLFTNVPLYEVERMKLNGCVKFPLEDLRYNGKDGVQFISVGGYGFYPNRGYVGEFTNKTFAEVRISDRWMGLYWDTIYHVYHAEVNESCSAKIPPEGIANMLFSSLHKPEDEAQPKLLTG